MFNNAKHLNLVINKTAILTHRNASLFAISQKHATLSPIYTKNR